MAFVRHPLINFAAVARAFYGGLENDRRYDQALRRRLRREEGVSEATCLRVTKIVEGLREDLTGKKDVR